MRLLVKTLQAVLIVLALCGPKIYGGLAVASYGITKGLLWTFSLLALADGVLVMGYVITGRLRTGKRKHKPAARGEE